MTIENQLRLSYYCEVAVIDKDHQVTLVQHLETHQFFVKKILSVYDLEIYTYFQSHPVKNMPVIYEVVQDENKLTVIEEYISGKTLQEMLDTDGPLSEAAVLDYMHQLCLILELLHSCHPAVIHRDLKPSNIIITPGGALKLLDLNAAKYVHETNDRDTKLLGTHGFAAPEQYGFGVSNTKTDIYALGILMNVLLTGEISHTCTAKSNLSPVICKCIMMDPNNRYASVCDVRSELLKLTPPDNLIAEPSGHSLLSGHLQLAETVPSLTDQNCQHNHLRFLPPGFRTRQPSHILLAVAGYLMIFWLGCTLEVKNAYGARLTLERFTLTLIFLSIVFFSNNYLNIHKHLPLCHSKNIFLRIPAILVADLLIMFFLAFIMVLTESVLF